MKFAILRYRIDSFYPARNHKAVSLIFSRAESFMFRAWPAVAVRHTIFVLIAGSCWFGGLGARAQVTSTITDVVVVKKPNRADGAAMATVKGPSTVKGKATVTGEKRTHRLPRPAGMEDFGRPGALLLMSPGEKRQTESLTLLRPGSGQRTISWECTLRHGNHDGVRRCEHPLGFRSQRHGYGYRPSCNFCRRCQCPARPH